MNHKAVCGDDREIFVAIKEGSLEFERILYILSFSLRNLLSQNSVLSSLQPIKSSEKRQFHV